MKLHILIVMAQKVCGESKDETEDKIGESRKLCEEIIVDTSNKPPMKEVKIFDRLANAKLDDAQQKGQSSAENDCITTGDKLPSYHLQNQFATSNFYMHFLHCSAFLKCSHWLTKP